LQSDDKAAAKIGRGKKKQNQGGGRGKALRRFRQFGYQAASPTVEAFHSAIKDIVRAKLAKSGGDWIPSFSTNPTT